MRLLLRSLLLSMCWSSVAWAVPDTILTIDPSATAGTTITASDENSRNNDISTAYNAHSHTDISSTTANTFNLGDGAAGNKTLCANAADSTDSCIRWNDTANLWVLDHPIVGSFNEIATMSGTSGLSANAVVIGDGTGALRTVTNAASGTVLVSQGSSSSPIWQPSASSQHVFVGSLTRDTSTASGTQTVTGVGFTPKAVVFLMGNTTADDENSFGVDSQTSQGVLYNNSGATADTWAVNTASSIVDQEDGTNSYSGKISSFTNDGFVITWTKTNSPTGTITVVYQAQD